MSDKKKSASHTSNVQDSQNQIPMAPLLVNGQYIKDLSFENPNPLKSLTQQEKAPEISVNVDLQANPVQDKTFEIVLHIKADATSDKERMFLVELEYAGIFTVGNIPEQNVHPILMIECPRILFPMARAIIANITREAGFPSLSLNPIDFAELYRQQFMSEAKSDPSDPKAKESKKSSKEH